MASLENFSLIEPHVTTRKYRKLMVESGIGVRTPRQASRILALLVESGAIYILIGVSPAMLYKHWLPWFILLFSDREPYPHDQFNALRTR
jgi:hypothetical protein